MKKIAFLLILGGAVFGAWCIFPSFRSIFFGPQITQEVSPSDDGKNEVTTLIWVNGHLPYAEYTWQTTEDPRKGITKDKVDSALAIQNIHAIEWIKTYRLNKY